MQLTYTIFNKYLYISFVESYIHMPVVNPITLQYLHITSCRPYIQTDTYNFSLLFHDIQMPM